MQYTMLDPTLLFNIMSLSIDCNEMFSLSFKIEKSKMNVNKLKNKFQDIITIIKQICLNLPFPTTFIKLYNTSDSDITNKEMDKWTSKEEIYPFVISLVILSNKILQSTKEFQFDHGNTKKISEDILSQLLYITKTCIKLAQVLNVDIEVS